MTEQIKTTFSRCIGIDYTGTETPDSRLNGLRIFEAFGESLPMEVAPSPSHLKE